MYILTLFVTYVSACSWYSDVDLCINRCECMWCYLNDISICVIVNSTNECLRHVTAGRECIPLNEWSLYEWKESRSGKIVLSCAILFVMGYSLYSVMVCILYEMMARGCHECEIQV